MKNERKIKGQVILWEVMNEINVVTIRKYTLTERNVINLMFDKCDYMVESSFFALIDIICVLYCLFFVP